MLKVLRMKYLSCYDTEWNTEKNQKKSEKDEFMECVSSISKQDVDSAFNVSEDTLNRFKMRGFGSLLEAWSKADTKHDIRPACH
ncbi:hypothetical protein Tco_0810973 [Tanacetum coccineum]